MPRPMDVMGTVNFVSLHPYEPKPMCDWDRQLQSWSHQSLKKRRREKLGGCFLGVAKKVPNNHRLDVENVGSFMGLAFFVEILIE